MFALGFVSVFDQIIEGLPGTAAADIFQAYMAALQEDPEKYRRFVSCNFCCHFDWNHNQFRQTLAAWYATDQVHVRSFDMHNTVLHMQSPCFSSPNVSSNNLLDGMCAKVYGSRQQCRHLYKQAVMVRH